MADKNKDLLSKILRGVEANAAKIDQLANVVGELKTEVRQNRRAIERNAADIKRIEAKLDANIKLTEYAHELIQHYHGKTPPPPEEDDDLLNERYVLGLTVKELFDDKWAKQTLNRIQKRFPSKTNRKLRIYIANGHYGRIRELLTRNDANGVLANVVTVRVDPIGQKE